MIKNFSEFLAYAPTVALAYVSTITSRHYIKTNFSKRLSSVVDVEESKSANEKDCIQRVFDKYRIAINEHLDQNSTVENKEEFVSLRALFDVANRIRHSPDTHLMDKGSVFLEYMHNQGFYFVQFKSDANKSQIGKKNIEDIVI